MQIALFGNPNCGKTTLFNELTGGNRSVGNWTGTTVTLEMGHFRYENQPIELVDIPGTYSLFTNSPEQLLAGDYLASQQADVLLNIVDATNLARNLYLTSQLIAKGMPMVVALNMSDELKKQGLSLDAKKLSSLLGVRCMKISAAKGQGLEELLAAVMAAEKPGKARKSAVLAEQQAQSSEQLYQAINDIVAQVLKSSPLRRQQTISKKIDSIVCHRALALPIFLVVMFLVFYLAFGPLGNAINTAFEHFFKDILAAWTYQALSALNASPLLIHLLVDGIISGVGTVMAFLPQLTILFFCLSLLEFSGYMARAAFITDKLLSKLGLSGMSFIPLVLGFGCSVPAIISCRALDNRRERLLTMLLIPFMSCSAKMPVYALLVGAFFREGQFLIIFAIYLLGVFMAFIASLLLRPKIMGKQKTAFLMEMPPYRRPIWHSIGNSVWMRVWDFIMRAGSLILLASIAVWFLANFSVSMQMVASSDSLLANIGAFIEPLFQPLGFGYWQIAMALLLGIMAKEAIISTLAVLYAGAASLPLALSSLLQPAAAFSLLVFILLYTPCIAAIVTMKRTSGSWKYTAFMIVFQLLIAWLMSFCTYYLALLFI